MIMSCEKCRTSFECKNKNRRFCSQKCADKARYIPKEKKGKFIDCINCGKSSWKMPCHFKYKNHFCSKKCHLEYLKKSAFSLKCIICKRIFYCQPCQIRYRHRKTCSIKCRGIYSTQLAEKRHQNGNLTKHQLDRAERYSKKADNWRREVFKRDDYTCQECGIRGTYLEADHIKPFAYFPELRYELSNGRTLCRKCHDKTKIGCKKMREIYVKN